MNSALREPRWSDVSLSRVAKLMLVLAGPISVGMSIVDGKWSALGLVAISGACLGLLIFEVRNESSRSPRTEGGDS
jgi:hypothetical protein